MGGEGRKADVAEAGPTHGERSSAALVEGTMYSLVGRQGWSQAQKRLTQICATESEAHSSLAAADPDERLTPSRWTLRMPDELLALLRYGPGCNRQTSSVMPAGRPEVVGRVISSSHTSDRLLRGLVARKDGVGISWMYLASEQTLWAVDRTGPGTGTRA